MIGTMTSAAAGRRAGRNGTALAVFAATAAATLAPVWNAPGWPSGHDGPMFAQRAHIYARHFADLDVMPIWSSADVNGFGSPMPLFYHKLFYVLAAPLAMLLPSMKTATVVAIVAVLVLGAVGMYRLVRELGASRLAATAAGCCLIAANYTVTNWLVRGAMAELTAAMLLPHLLLYFSRAVEQGRMPAALGACLGLVWLGHSVMAYYAALILAATYLVLASAGAARWSVLHPATAWRPVVVFALLVLPYLVPMAIVGAQYDLSRFLSPPLHPSYQFRPLSWYLWDRQWTFGHTVSGLTRQIDLPMLALIGIVAATLATRHHRRADAPGPEAASTRPRLAPLLVPVALCLLLQMPWTEWFYLHVPGAAYIQFPWRLLAVLTPALIAVALVLADRLLPHDARLLALGGATAWMIAGSGAFVPLVDPRLSVDPVTLAGVNFSGYREYEPVMAPPLADLRGRIADRWAAAGCAYEREAPDAEMIEVRFAVVCAHSGVLPLPVYASPLHRVSTAAFNRRVRCQALADIPAVCGVTVPAGRTTVVVEEPTMGAVVRELWARLTRGSDAA